MGTYRLEIVSGIDGDLFLSGRVGLSLEDVIALSAEEMAHPSPNSRSLRVVKEDGDVVFQARRVHNADGEFWVATGT